MNYLSEIKEFNNWLVENPVSAICQALWYRLMAYCNDFYWKENFTLTNTRLIDELNISRKQLETARDILVENKLIKYEKGMNGKCGIYSMISFHENNKIHKKVFKRNYNKFFNDKKEMQKQYEIQNYNKKYNKANFLTPKKYESGQLQEQNFNKNGNTVCFSSSKKYELGQPQEQNYAKKSDRVFLSRYKNASERDILNKQNKTKLNKTKPFIQKEINKEKSCNELFSEFTNDEKTIVLLNDWLEIRKVNKAATTTKAIKLNLDKLRQLAKESNLSVNSYLEEIIRRGWKSFYVIEPSSFNKRKKALWEENQTYDLEEVKKYSPFDIETERA